MKRHLIRITISVLIGIVTTMAVVLASSVFVGFHNKRSDIRAFRVAPDGRLNIETYNLPTAFRLDLFRSSQPAEVDSIGPAPGSLVPTWLPSIPELATDEELLLWDVEARGWPLLAAWTVVDSASRSNDGVIRKSEVQYGITLPFEPFAGGMGYMKRVLPLRPIFPGFLINTLFYATIWFALFAACGSARNAIRKKRGQCIKCGYDLRGGDVDSRCPECGWQPT